MGFSSPAVIVGIVVAFIVIVFIGMFMFIFTGLSMTSGFSTFIFAPFCGIAVVILIVAVLAASQGWGRAQIPPPPPIQQPMVPAGAQGPIALNCPNCGAPPTVVDRFGVATCTYCNTRFLVR